MKLVTPYSTGIGPDLYARALAEQLQKEWGQPVVVEAKPGGNGFIAVEQAKKAVADGHELLILANSHLTISLPTGMGQARNVLIVTAAESVIAIGEGWGTLSEIAVARRIGRPVVALDSWSVKGLESVDTPEDPVRRALE